MKRETLLEILMDRLNSDTEMKKSGNHFPPSKCNSFIIYPISSTPHSIMCRFEQDPFPLYPGEKLFGKVAALQVVAPNTAMRVKAIRDFTDEEGTTRRAGDEWLFEGPGTYIPRIEVQVVEIVKATIVKPNQALKIRARKAFVDREGKERKAGEEWLVRSVGAYLAGIHSSLLLNLTIFF